MKTILVLITLFPIMSYAHCPVALEVNGEQYCTAVEWQKTTQKVSGQYQETTNISPYLIPAGEMPQKWQYANAEFLIWKKGDSTHTPQKPEGLRIFPYMVMANGHHHGTSYTFDFEVPTQKFILNSAALQSMPGCWSLRWTTAADDGLESSQPLENITAYTNLNDGDLAQVISYCNSSSENGTPENGGHHHH